MVVRMREITRRTIEIDAARWTSIVDFYNALFVALGAPAGHGYNINALIDSMIYGGINKIDPPYTVRISGATKLPKDLRDEIKLYVELLIEARDEARGPDGGDVDVQFEADI
jgi:hypothetical protein